VESGNGIAEEKCLFSYKVSGYLIWYSKVY